MAASSLVSTIIVGAILVAIVVLIIRKMRKNKKNGIGSCGCNCSGCAMGCHDMEKNLKK
ncbi:MAG TPA: FeoB-associated Cys-rich membrane protein [Candidatus Dorea intestinavium]|nr:FeoB-associated Cys-rich membrane protein [Candidatus Dorea intestinavium]